MGLIAMMPACSPASADAVVSTQLTTTSSQTAYDPQMGVAVTNRAITEAGSGRQKWQQVWTMTMACSGQQGVPGQLIDDRDTGSTRARPYLPMGAKASIRETVTFDAPGPVPSIPPDLAAMRADLLRQCDLAIQNIDREVEAALKVLMPKE